MSAPTLPTDRLAQELEFVAVIRTLDQGICSPENAEKFAAAGKSIVGMIQAGLDVNRGFTKEGLEHFTPIGLFNAMSKDLIPPKGIQKVEGLAPSVAVPTIASFVKTYREVLTASLNANPKLVMHTLGDDMDMEDFQSTAGMMDLKDATLVGRCLKGGIEFNPDAFSHLSRNDMVGLMKDPTVMGHLKKLSFENPLIENLNEINSLILLRPEELKEYLTGPGRQFLPDETLNHAYHCAITNRTKPETIEVWLDAGANVEGSGRSIFDKTALGSAIFASPLHGADDPAMDPTIASTMGALQALAQGADPSQLPGALGGLLKAAQANGTQVIGVGPGGAQVNIGAGGAQITGGIPMNGAPAEPVERCVVELLIERGAEVNPICGRKSPLAQAYEKGSPVLIDLLESKGALFTHETEKKEAYLRCAEHGSNKALEKLYAQNIGIDDVITRVTRSPATDTPMTNEHTALTMASMMGKASTVEMLIERGADPEVKVHRTVAFASHDEEYRLNFIQEAIRLDQPQVLEVAIKHLGVDRVLQEDIPKGARTCVEFMQGVKAALAANVLTPAAAPAP